jgi:hypothetical protein
VFCLACRGQGVGSVEVACRGQGVGSGGLRVVFSVQGCVQGFDVGFRDFGVWGLGFRGTGAVKSGITPLGLV